MSRLGPGPFPQPPAPPSPTSARSQIWGWCMLLAIMVLGVVVYLQGVPRVPKRAWVHYLAENGQVRSVLADDVMCRSGWVEFTSEEGRKVRAYAATVEYPE